MMDNEPQTEGPTQWSARAIALAEILEPLRDLKTLDPGSLERAVQQAAPWYGGTPPSDMTIRNLLRRYKALGIGGLERSRNRNKGQSTLSPLLRQHIIDYILSETQPSLKEVWRDAKKYASDVLQLPKPTYDQIRYLDAQVPQDLKVMGREGRKAYRDKQELVERFDGEYPNQVWQGDAHWLDIIVIDEVTGEERKRPWLTIFMDDYSRTIPGLYLEHNTPTSMSIALALRHAMLPKPDLHWEMQGIPEELYIDNGKSYLSHHIREVCLHFKTKLNPHEPYLARAKGKIERFFRTLEEQCISKLDGYVGSSVAKRPRRVRPKLTLEELRIKIVEFLLDEYHEEPHAGIKRRMRWLQPERQRVIQLVDTSDERNLDFLLKSDDRLVGREGIRWNNRFYRDSERLIQPYIGFPIRFFYDSRDTSKIHVYAYEEGGLKFICIANEQGIKPKSQTDPQAIAASSKKPRKELAKQVRGSRKRRKAAVKAMEEAKTRKKSGVTQPPIDTEEATKPEETVEPTIIRFLHHIGRPKHDD